MSWRIQSDNTLIHYGVLGMKWGIRKDKETVADHQKKISKETLLRKQTGDRNRRQGNMVGRPKTETTGVTRDKNGKFIGINRTVSTYNYTTGKTETTNYLDTHAINGDVREFTDEQLMYMARTDYDKIKSGEKPKTYIDKDGNIWQWDGRKGDYVKLGGTKGKMKETLSYKVSQIGKKIGDAVNKALEVGKNFLTKLFNVKPGTKTTTRGTDRKTSNTTFKTTSGIGAFVPKNAKLGPTKQYKDINDWRKKNKR